MERDRTVTQRVDPEVAISKATDILVAYLGRSSVEPNDLPRLVREVRDALWRDPTVIAADPVFNGAGQPVASEIADGQPFEAAPPVVRSAAEISQSITPDYLVSFEDGRYYRSLKRHLMAKYGLTPQAYRQKWGLPPDYPMVAPSYAKERSDVAKRTGLGRQLPARGKAQSSPRARRVSKRAQPG